MRPSLRKPILTRECSAGRARPMYCSCSRVMRIITGAPVFFASSAGTTTNTVPDPLLPNPPPVYSLMMTTSSGLMPTHRATAPIVRIVLWVEQCM